MAVLESTIAAIKHYCAYQERCHSEVRHKLISLECYGEELEEAMSVLIEEDYLNEERFAASYARGKFRMNKWGKTRIKQQLKLKKVSEYCIKKGIAQIEEAAYLDTLSGLMEKKITALAAEKNEWVRKQKVHHYLLQKGFEPELIQEVWEQQETDLNTQ
ncbi:regulatory protein RecX [Taibaiella sp. KBW10]|uniref:regulatory protein RecX n=1 Tax=Taibaiella sp. KBW10 TaxID=2153357 RepID=UPI0018F34F18|nr:regulatory protein RecX [Taibaiella sp. KBW10]